MLRLLRRRGTPTTARLQVPDAPDPPGGDRLAPRGILLQKSVRLRRFTGIMWRRTPVTVSGPDPPELRPVGCRTKRQRDRDLETERPRDMEREPYI